MWLCSVHNMINERLGKDEFDCLTLNDVYDCGCGPEEEGKGATATAVEGVKKAGEKAADKVAVVKEKVAGAKEHLKETVQAVKEKGKEVLSDEEPTAAPAPEVKLKINRPLGGMNAKEKEKDGAMAEQAKAAKEAAAQVKEEVIYKPKGAKARPAEPEPEPEPEQEVDAVMADEVVSDIADVTKEPYGETGAEDEDETVPTELTGENEEAEEDDSGLADEGDEGELEGTGDVQGDDFMDE